jgi:hypothetical protein
MREELKKITEDNYWCYGLNETDFDFTLRLTQEYILCRRHELEREKEKAISDYPDPKIHGEIISDLAHYTWVNAQYLWEFCLWRFQGIFEGLIIHVFLPKRPKKKMLGLKAKLDAIIKTGYRLENNEYEELIEWANLRNALSHAPPEQYRPAPLKKSDVLEYKNLLVKLCKRWRSEKKDAKNERNV